MSFPPRRQRFAKWLESRLAALAALCFRQARWALALTALWVVVSLALARGLSLNADLAALLPESFASVQDLKTLEKRLGGVGYVAVMASGAPPIELRRFADKAASQLVHLPEVARVDYQRPGSFFSDRALYYLDQEDLETIKERVSHRVDWELSQRSDLFLSLDDTEEGPPRIDISDIEEKYQAQRKGRWLDTQQGGSYYADDESRQLVLLVKPNGPSTDLQYVRKITVQIKHEISTLDLASFHPDLRVDFGGSFTKKVEQQEIIQADLLLATATATGLVLLYLIAHFRRLSAALVVLAPLLVGLTATHGLVFLAFGQLSILTAFIGAILLGLGIDQGIHLLGSFSQRWTGTENAEAAVRTTFAGTGRAVTIAAITTLFGFAALGVSEFRAFHEFGIIAALGIGCIVIAYSTCLPALIGVLVARGWEPHAVKSRLTSQYGLLMASRPALPMALFLLVAVPSVALSGDLGFNFDFRQLSPCHLPSFRMDKKIDKLLGHSQTPIAVLTETPEDSAAALAELRTRQRQRGKKSTIHLVASGSEIVPDEQEQKYFVIAELARQLRRIRPTDLSESDRSRYDRLKKLAQAKPFGPKDLPESVRQRFFGSGGDSGSMALVFTAVDLSDGKNASRFAREVRGLKLPSGKAASAAGSQMILADIVDLVRRETPRVLTGTLVLVFLCLVLMLGRLDLALLSLLPAVLGLAMTFGLSYLCGFELNSLNIVVVPVLFGLGVDGGVHLVTRMADTKNLETAVADTCGAVTGALITTGIGFGTLLLADHRGLNSLAQIAVLGLAANLLCSVLLLPSVLLWLQRSGLRFVERGPVPSQPTLHHTTKSKKR